MNAIALSCITFACISVGALLGMFLPGHHLSTDDKDVVRLGTGLIGTIAALVLGLLIASAQGPEATELRSLLRRGIAVLADRMWPENSSDVAKTRPFVVSGASDAFFAKLQQLSPQNDSQRSLQARAIQIATDIAQARLLLFAQTNNSIPMPFLVVLIFWLTIIFGSFGLFAKPSATVFGSLFVFALSAAGAIYLVLELGQPFAGLMQISSAPLRGALIPLTP